MSDLDAIVKRADDLVEAGHLSEAQRLVEKVLAEAPDHKMALQVIAGASLLQNNHVRAYEYFMIASAMDPESSELHTGLGISANALGRHSDAAMHFRTAIDLSPDDPELHLLLSNTLLAAGRRAETLASSERSDALRLRNRTSDRAHTLQEHPQPVIRKPSWRDRMSEAVSLFQAGRLDEAEAILHTVIAQQPDHAAAHALLGETLQTKRRNAEAETCFRRAIDLGIGGNATYNNLGIVLGLQNRSEEAIQCYLQAIERGPEFVGSYVNLAMELGRQGDLEQAEALCRRALELDPQCVDALTHLGAYTNAQGRSHEAERVLRRATSLQPNSAAAHYNLAVVLLRRGDYAAGWIEYEWRRLAHPDMLRRNVDRPLWRGKALQGKRLLVCAEQGFGDTIQFARFIALAHERGAYVLFEHQPELGSLLLGLSGADELLPMRADLKLPDIPFDYHIDLMSLPKALGIGLEALPGRTPYLSADLSRVLHWRERLAADGHGYRVGLVWACKNLFPDDFRRSTTLRALTPLARIPGLLLYSLQKGAGAAEATDPSQNLNVIDLSPDLHDFTDTAAVIQCLDLVITVDTSIAHLAGALGRPVWTLLEFNSSWRWMLGCADTPWYPTMRLFRQSGPGEWDAVVSRVRDEIGRQVERRPLKSSIPQGL